MNSQSIALISESPIVKEIAVRIITRLQCQRYPLKCQLRPREKRTVVNPDLVPRISPRTFELHQMQESVMQPTQPQPPQPPQVSQQTIQKIIPLEDYGKLIPLIQDPSVSQINVDGENRQVTILKMGRQQATQITLTKQEIDGLIKHISEKVRIPLIGGVFKAAVDDFIINAVLSDVVSSRFMIRKQQPRIPDYSQEQQSSPQQRIQQPFPRRQLLRR